MLYLFKGLRTEWIKTRRGFALAYVILCPLLLASLVFLLFMFRSTAGVGGVEDKMNYWYMALIAGYNSLAYLFLPMFVVLLSTTLYSREHQGNMWKHLYSLPIPRWSVFGAKSLYSFLLFLASFILFFIFILLACYAVDFIKPIYKFSKSDHLLDRHFILSARIFVSGLGIWAIHNWLSARFKGAGIGIGIAIASIVLTPFILTGAEKLGDWRFLYPYICPFEAASDFHKPDKILYKNFAQPETYASLAYFVLFLVIGYWDSIRNMNK